jgi:selenocysteine lyase/cysteine desulfurase
VGKISERQHTTHLGLEVDIALMRVGPVHYNTVEELRRFGEVLGRMASRTG